MSILQSPFLLRRVLAVDAASSAALGLLLVSAASSLEALLGLPAPLLRTAGLVLLPFAAFVAALARQAVPWRAGVWAVIVCNALWVIDSIAVLLTGHAQPTTLGAVFVVGQAVLVALMAELAVIGLRGPGRLAAA